MNAGSKRPAGTLRLIPYGRGPSKTPSKRLCVSKVAESTDKGIVNAALDPAATPRMCGTTHSVCALDTPVVLEPASAYAASPVPFEQKPETEQREILEARAIQPDYVTDRFISKYYRKYAKPIDYRDRSRTRKWLNDNYRVPLGQRGRCNINSFAGGAWFVPPPNLHLYWKWFHHDVVQRKPLVLNERSPDRGTLVFELDYVMPDPTQMPTDEVLLAQIRAIHNVVVEAHNPISRDSLRLFVFECQPKPKLKRGRWVIAYGLHLIYNRNVLPSIGAHLSLEAQRALEEISKDYKDIVDNVYVKHGRYASHVTLRPPFASKIVRCWTCYDRRGAPTASSSSSSTSTSANMTPEQALAQGLLDDLTVHSHDTPCPDCWDKRKSRNRCRVVDTNTYKLWFVWNDMRKNMTKIEKWDEDVLKLLQTCSVLSNSNMQAQFVVDNDALHTLQELCQEDERHAPAGGTSLFDGRRDVLSRQLNQEAEARAVMSNAQGKPVTMRKMLLSLGFKTSVLKCPRKVKPYVVLEHKGLQERLTVQLRKIKPYGSCKVNKVLQWYNNHFLLVTLFGDMHRYCHVIRKAHGSNGARVLFSCVNGECNVYGGCFSKRCNRFVPVLTSSTQTELANLFAESAKLVVKPILIAADQKK